MAISYLCETRRELSPKDEQFLDTQLHLLFSNGTNHRRASICAALARKRGDLPLEVILPYVEAKIAYGTLLNAGHGYYKFMSRNAS